MTTSVLLSLAAMLTAAPPAPPSPEQLEDLARLTTPIGSQAKQHRQQALKSVNASEQLSAAADAVMKPFLKGIGQDTLLAQNNTPTPSGTPSATPATTPTAPPTASPSGKSKNNSKPAAKKDQPSTIKVEFDGGFYFDGKAGVLAYLKNIRLTESGSSFKLRCRDELKVFLDTPPEDPGENRDSNKEPLKDPKKEPKKKDNSFAELGDLKQIIATGDVKIVGQNHEQCNDDYQNDYGGYNRTANPSDFGRKARAVPRDFVGR